MMSREETIEYASLSPGSRYVRDGEDFRLAAWILPIHLACVRAGVSYHIEGDTTTITDRAGRKYTIESRNLGPIVEGVVALRTGAHCDHELRRAELAIAEGDKLLAGLHGARARMALHAIKELLK